MPTYCTKPYNIKSATMPLFVIMAQVKVRNGTYSLSQWRNRICVVDTEAIVTKLDIARHVNRWFTLT